MKLTWVNHASFIVDTHDVRLMCDPWIEGSVFNRGWSLLSPSKFSYQDFRSITHIFISHQHPDHFSPPNLRKIPEEVRRKIIVLFHHTKDKRVLRYCKTLGFQTRELPDHQWVALAAGVRVMCGPQGALDSWLAVRSPDGTLLNLNDCVFTHSQLATLGDRVGHIDVLLTQFSYGSWVGNRDDVSRRCAATRRKLREIQTQIGVFRPTVYIPAASYIWFSHEENYYMNSGVNTAETVYEYCTQQLGVLTLVMYPGDVWNVGDHFDSGSALARYRADHQRVNESPELTRTRAVSLEQLRSAERLFRKKIWHRNPHLMLRAIPPAVAYVYDLDIHVQISLARDMRVLSGSDRSADVVLAAESLYYCLHYDWGGNALAVNGRYQVPTGGSARKFFWLFEVALLNSTGESLTPIAAIRRALTQISRAIDRP